MRSSAPRRPTPLVAVMVGLTLASGTLAPSVAGAETLGTITRAGSAATPTCFGRTATIVGGTGDRVIQGTSGADVIVAGPAQRVYGNGGDDRICNASRARADRTRWPKMFGGAGRDRIRGWSIGTALQFLYGGTGDDIIIGGTSMHGGTGTDSLRSTGEGGTYLTGGRGPDTMVGGPTLDEFVAGPGADTITASLTPACPDPFCDFVLVRHAGVVDLNAGYVDDGEHRQTVVTVHKVWAQVRDGRIILRGSSGPDVLSAYCRPSTQKPTCGRRIAVLNGRAQDDFLSGGHGPDQLRGGPGNDRLRGVQHDDVLQGGRGDDHLNGGSGVDECTGDAGADILVHCEP